ncbi:MAG: Asp-tRNA(Asn)/Glu-tRNA(Gln) amidotransferase subunit GatA [Bacilli bacterium]|nr:Asp-tRNA(Asn)/Glu-tRNA(Gln) amidotransferase subunit GatA [Bacilli bacterium]
MNIEEFRKKIDENGIKEVFNESVKISKERQKDVNAFVTIMDSFEKSSSLSKISNIPYALKDNFSTKGILTTASSNMLKDYIPVYDSTVYKKLKESGAILLGKTTLDELAMGGTGTTGHTGIVRNPIDTTRSISGSSSGSAAAVRMGVCPFAIGSDTGDSVRKPASYAGIVGFKPTYGRISRFGLFAFASSLDTVGIMATSVKDVAIVTDILKGKDENDMTSLDNDDEIYENLIEKDVKGLKLAYIEEICDEDNNKEIFNKIITSCETLGMTVEKVNMDKKLLEAVFAAYRTISCAETTSNNANLSGILFGPRAKGSTPDEIIFNSRTEGFSELIKRRFIMGSYVLRRENQEKLYLNACKIRRLIVDKTNEIFNKYDAIILPTTKDIAPKLEQEKEIINDKFSVLENHLDIANFGGYPSITIPSFEKDGMPLGVSIMCNIKKDALTLNIAHKLFEKLRGEENV